MITVDEVRKLVLRGFPDAAVEVSDMTGTLDHFDITITSQTFAGKPLIEQHRMVYAVLDAEMKDRIHAVQLHTRAH